MRVLHVEGKTGRRKCRALRPAPRRALTSSFCQICPYYYTKISWDVSLNRQITFRQNMLHQEKILEPTSYLDSFEWWTRVRAWQAAEDSTWRGWKTGRGAILDLRSTGSAASHGRLTHPRGGPNAHMLIFYRGSISPIRFPLPLSFPFLSHLAASPRPRRRAPALRSSPTGPCSSAPRPTPHGPLLLRARAIGPLLLHLTPMGRRALAPRSSQTGPCSSDSCPRPPAPPRASGNR